MMSFENFSTNLNQYYKIPPLELEMLKNMATSIILKKEEIFIRENNAFDKEVFIEKGIVRGFIVDNNGNEKSTSFFETGNFMSTNSLRNNNGRSIHNYQALCQAELLFFDEKEIRNFFSGNEFLTQIGRKIKESELERINARDKCLLQVNSIDKYTEFLKCYPSIEQHIAQKHIASYLGITPVSLSRIKSKLITFDNRISPKT